MNVRKKSENDLKKSLFDILTKDTTLDEVRVLLKLAADSTRRKTFGELLAEDAVYKRQEQAYMDALGEYNSLKLTNEQKNVVENLLAKTSELCFEESLISYCAGIINGYQLLKALDVTNE